MHQIYFCSLNRLRIIIKTMGRLDGKVIVLSAAAQGIGRASAIVTIHLPLSTFKACLILLSHFSSWSLYTALQLIDSPVCHFDEYNKWIYFVDLLLSWVSHLNESLTRKGCQNDTAIFEAVMWGYVILGRTV